MNRSTNLLIVGPSIPQILQKNSLYNLIHHPLIALRSLPVSYPLLVQVSRSNNLIITSQYAVSFLNQALIKTGLTLKITHLYCVGRRSAQVAHVFFPQATVVIASKETQEGIIEMINIAQGTTIAWPRSSMARPLLAKALLRKGISLLDIPLYEPYETKNIPSLTHIDEIFFSCPSSVRAFFALFSLQEVSHLTFSAIGPITKQQLQQKGITHVKLYSTASSI